MVANLRHNEYTGFRYQDGIDPSMHAVPFQSYVRDWSSIMASEKLAGGCPSSGSAHSKSAMVALNQYLFEALWRFALETESFIHDWTPLLLVMSYFTFSICLYMFCTEALVDMFWFFYLITNFYIAGSAALEALMSMGPCRDARLAVRKVQQNGWVFPTPNNDLLFLDLLIVCDFILADLICACRRDSLRSGRLPTE